MNIKNIVPGTFALAEWFGQSRETVPHKVADHRSLVCVQCPLNIKKGWVESWGKGAMKLMGIIEWLHENGCATKRDERLHVCDACDCPMVIKIHCPDEIIKKHITDDQRKRLWKGCWIK